MPTSTLLDSLSIEKFEIAQSYFSDILNAQLVIFSLIVAALLGLSWLYNYRTSKNRIKDFVLEETNKVKKELHDNIDIKVEEFKNSLDEAINAQKYDIRALRGEIYRTLGQFHDSQKDYNVAFIWWIRAAHNFSKCGDENITRISLGGAKESVEKVQYGFELDYRTIGEYQELIGEIDSVKYKIEKEMLEKAIKNVLEKKTS